MSFDETSTSFQCEYYYFHSFFLWFNKNIFQTTFFITLCDSTGWFVIHINGYQKTFWITVRSVASVLLKGTVVDAVYIVRVEVASLNKKTSVSFIEEESLAFEPAD